MTNSSMIPFDTAEQLGALKPLATRGDLYAFHRGAHMLKCSQPTLFYSKLASYVGLSWAGFSWDQLRETPIAVQSSHVGGVSWGASQLISGSISAWYRPI